MQDRLNFRFWDTKERVMLGWDCICQTAFNCTRDEGNEMQRYGLMYFVFTTLQRFIPLQCTGLKDKTGKLIFEGDILRVTGSRDTSGYGVVEYLQCGCKFIVTGYLDNPSGYYPRKKGELCRDLEEWLCTEVIGNIYQNPELLEVNNDTK
ncbi:MAG TPA: hypothetical protein IAD11_06400 [Candidatus Stercorousia faecigallinarum]|nr:hypothetical protein [Candidatus Stercorousia faecigallinarum]